MPYLELIIAIINRERGIPSKRQSSAGVDYVPALCTHRPSLLLIGCLSETFGFLANNLGYRAKKEVDLAYVSRGSKSRNKVSVGEPAEGSVIYYHALTSRGRCLMRK